MKFTICKTCELMLFLSLFGVRYFSECGLGRKLFYNINRNLKKETQSVQMASDLVEGVPKLYFP